MIVTLLALAATANSFASAAVNVPIPNVNPAALNQSVEFLVDPDVSSNIIVWPWFIQFLNGSSVRIGSRIGNGTDQTSLPYATFSLFDAIVKCPSAVSTASAYPLNTVIYQAVTPRILYAQVSSEDIRPPPGRAGPPPQGPPPGGGGGGGRPPPGAPPLFNMSATDSNIFRPENLTPAVSALLADGLACYMEYKFVLPNNSTTIPPINGPCFILLPDPSVVTLSPTGNSFLAASQDGTKYSCAQQNRSTETSSFVLPLSYLLDSSPVSSTTPSPSASTSNTVVSSTADTGGATMSVGVVAAISVVGALLFAGLVVTSALLIRRRSRKSPPAGSQSLSNEPPVSPSSASSTTTTSHHPSDAIPPSGIHTIVLQHPEGTTTVYRTADGHIVLAPNPPAYEEGAGSSLSTQQPVSTDVPYDAVPDVPHSSPPSQKASRSVLPLGRVQTITSNAASAGRYSPSVDDGDSGKV
ncbi:hypothetical protein BJ742DRAFT_810428 [Cladochytrium replicatum]|nr:hypothetical protein BJ742DRAFT_810428 [Cladochytrium replicatum]